MNRYKWLILLGGLMCLASCSNKEDHQKTASSSQQTDLVKTHIFEIPVQDGSQEQTIVYKNDKIQQLILKSKPPLTEELETSISEHGLAETKKRIEESVAQDTVYQELSAVKGLSYVIDLTDSKDFSITFTLDATHLDAAALSKTSYFKDSGLEDITVLTARQYMERLESHGAKEITPKAENKQELFSLPKD